MKIPLSHGSIVHDTDVFVTAAKFRMIFLLSKTLRTSKFAAITHTTLWTVVESRPFSGWGNFSPEATLHGRFIGFSFFNILLGAP